jgi:hypothetical protein
MRSTTLTERILNNISWQFRCAYWALRGRRPILTDSFKAWRHKLYQSTEEEERNQ